MAETPGADHDVTYALDLLMSYGERDPHDPVVALALNYLYATIPVNTHARALLVILADNLDAYRRGRYSGVPGITEFEPVADVLHMLRRALDTAGLPRLERPRTPAQLAAIAERLGLRRDWHEPDEQAVDARAVANPSLNVTDGGFDNAGHSVLEQTVILYQDRIPIAEVALATLFAWACRAAGTDPTPPAAAATLPAPPTSRAA